MKASLRGDTIYQTVITAFAAVIPLLLVLIAISIGIAAWPAISRFGLSFLTDSKWSVANHEFGAAPAIYGTLVSSAIALVLATPLALGVSIFLSEIAPKRVRQPIAFLADLLADLFQRLRVADRRADVRAIRGCATLLADRPPDARVRSDAPAANSLASTATTSLPDARRSRTIACITLIIVLRRWFIAFRSQRACSSFSRT